MQYRWKLRYYYWEFPWEFSSLGSVTGRPLLDMGCHTDLQLHLLEAAWTHTVIPLLYQVTPSVTLMKRSSGLCRTLHSRNFVPDGPSILFYYLHPYLQVVRSSANIIHSRTRPRINCNYHFNHINRRSSQMAAMTGAKSKPWVVFNSFLLSFVSLLLVLFSNSCITIPNSGE